MVDDLTPLEMSLILSALHQQRTVHSRQWAGLVENLSATEKVGNALIEKRRSR